ncbi:unnamed protein product [Sphagnum troendelagicum]|uniref:Uncharacterized protein n=1 Tax=Sphagnum troendelagicum TaxID=128251 RepID=A0ABP0UTQ5_9BRYO
MLLKLCFDAHCLVARFPGCPMLQGWKSCSGSSFANSFNLFRHHLVNCNSKCRVLGLEIRCVLSLWKGPRSIQNIVWDFFTGKASGVFVCIFS